MAAPSSIFTVDIYDGADVLQETIAMTEIMSGIYKAETTATGLDLWAIVNDSNGNKLDIVRVEPRVGSIWQLPDALNIWRYLGLK